MKFVDIAEIFVKAGRGGNGAFSIWRRCGGVYLLGKANGVNGGSATEGERQDFFSTREIVSNPRPVGDERVSLDEKRVSELRFLTHIF